MKKLWLLALTLLSTGSVAAAELPAQPLPHDAQSARCRIGELAKQLGQNDFSELPSTLTIVTDSLGTIDRENSAALFEMFEASERKNRDIPLSVRAIGILVPGQTSASYVVDLNRGRWGIGSIWLVVFDSNAIVKIKEAPELYAVTQRNDAFGVNYCASSSDGRPLVMRPARMEDAIREERQLPTHLRL